MKAEELEKAGQLSAAQERRIDAAWFHHLIIGLEEGKMEEINSYIIHTEDILTDESISGCDKPSELDGGLVFVRLGKLDYNIAKQRSLLY